ncbi:MAG TPA: UpxY family transcription antiterminator [Paludibacter sp.]|nr:UpxY family transcription antiterminator [Paludibacter sp.]
MQSKNVRAEKWYVLYTSPRAEKQVEMRIKELDIEVFLPLHKSPRRWSDRIKIVEIPLYSSYIFVHTSHEKLYQLLKIPGVARIVFFCGLPAVVSPKEINAIRSFLVQTEGLSYTFEIDDEIRIALGPLKDLCGRIKKIGKKYIVLSVEQIGMTVVAGLDQVVKK